MHRFPNGRFPHIGVLVRRPKCKRGSCQEGRIRVYAAVKSPQDRRPELPLVVLLYDIAIVIPYPVTTHVGQYLFPLR